MNLIHIIGLVGLILIIMLILFICCKNSEDYTIDSSSKRKVVFLAFGGPTQGFYDAIDRIKKEAEDINVFDKILTYTDKDLKKDEEFWKIHGDRSNNNKRGYGYWAWKPYLIKKELDKLDDNDILFYVDVGCTINKDGRKRLLEYIDMLKTSKETGIIGFHLLHTEKKYTKKLLLREFGFENNKDVLDSGQFISTLVPIIKNKHSMNIVNEWYKYNSNFDLVNDVTENEYPEFIEHRHDQSILSLLLKKYGCISLKDETYDDNYPGIWKSEYPFWATRKRPHYAEKS